MKKLLGKFSRCKITGLGAFVHLLRYFNIDKNLTVTGSLYHGNKTAAEARWIMKVALNQDADFDTKFKTT